MCFQSVFERGDRRLAHLPGVLLADQTGGAGDGSAGLVQAQPLHMAVAGDALSLGGALHLLDLHSSAAEPSETGYNELPSDRRI